eukprot:480215-Amphidinium_carterae.1
MASSFACRRLRHNRSVLRMQLPLLFPCPLYVLDVPTELRKYFGTEAEYDNDWLVPQPAKHDLGSSEPRTDDLPQLSLLKRLDQEYVARLECEFQASVTH